MGELDALEDDLAMEAAAPGATPAYLQVCRRRAPGWLALAAVVAVVAVHRSSVWVASLPSAEQRAAEWRGADWARPCFPLPLKNASARRRTWICQRCRRGRRSRRRLRTSLGCPPSRSARSGLRARGGLSSNTPPLIAQPCSRPCTLLRPDPSTPVPPATHHYLLALPSPLAPCTAPRVSCLNWFIPYSVPAHAASGWACNRSLRTRAAEQASYGGGVGLVGLRALLHV